MKEPSRRTEGLDDAAIVGGMRDIATRAAGHEDLNARLAVFSISKVRRLRSAAAAAANNPAAPAPITTTSQQPSDMMVPLLKPCTSTWQHSKQCTVFTCWESCTFPRLFVTTAVRKIVELAHKEKALVELDKHNWPWSMMLVPVMPVDLYELSNNHIWRTEYAMGNWGNLLPST